jgi:hypothetical protein
VARLGSGPVRSYPPVMLALRVAPLILLLAACSAGQPPPAKPRAADAPAAEKPAATAKRVPKPAATAASEPQEEPEPVEDTTPREVRYLVKPDGLQIDVVGVRFRPKATAVKVGGGWGVNVEVETSAEDDQQHSLLAGTDGALAFAGSVKRGGSEQRFKDQRGVTEEQTVFPGAPVTLSRQWPEGTGQKPLAAGDELVLQVGLWGVGDDARSRRPVMKFFQVRMKVGAKTPEPKVEPPTKL